jgi:GGDEF domain-containing protein
VTCSGDDGIPEPPDPEHVSAIAESAPRVSLGNREDLLADLADAMRPGVLRTALVIFGLTGFPEFVDRVGWFEGEALLDGLAARLDGVVGGSATCYRARRDEFALLLDPESASLAPLLERAITALGEHHGQVAPAYGTVVVPDEASRPLAALQLADERLSSAQPGRQPRARRSYLRPVSSAEPVTTASPAATPQPESPTRIWRVERLLDIAETLTKLADAARIDDAGPGRLQGQASGADKIPLLLKELALKLAALKALDGSEIAEAETLLQSPVAGTMRTKVLSALDEIGLVLAAA